MDGDDGNGSPRAEHGFRLERSPSPYRVVTAEQAGEHDERRFFMLEDLLSAAEVAALTDAIDPYEERQEEAVIRPQPGGPALRVPAATEGRPTRSCTAASGSSSRSAYSSTFRDGLGCCRRSDRTKSGEEPAGVHRRAAWRPTPARTAAWGRQCRSRARHPLLGDADHVGHARHGASPFCDLLALGWPQRPDDRAGDDSVRRGCVSALRSRWVLPQSSSHGSDPGAPH